MTHGYATWEEALSEALLCLGQIPFEHNLANVKFGTFSDSVGGGHYFSLMACYSLGNTVDDRPRSVDITDVSRRRNLQVLEAWHRAREVPPAAKATESGCAPGCDYPVGRPAHLKACRP
jgi:hypothetical protein